MTTISDRPIHPSPPTSEDGMTRIWPHLFRIPAFLLLSLLFVGAGVSPSRASGLYRIGVADSLIVNVWDEPKLNGGYDVLPDGTITMPLAGTFRAELLDRGIVEEAVIIQADIKRATNVWFINSVRGWVPVQVDE